LRGILFTKVMARIDSYKDLIVYQKAYGLSMEIFELSEEFPEKEKYSLTDQIRRSSRSIVACIAESWAKRLYVKVFVNKITDSLGEEYETEVWLNYAFDCKYISASKYEYLSSGYVDVRRLLISMLKNPEKWCK